MSFVRHTYHIIFSTKERQKIIIPDIKADLYAYIGGIIREMQGHLIAIGGVSDHIHIFARLHQSHAISNVIRDVKSGSSRWMNKQQKVSTHFRWQKKYGSFSVSRSQEDQVENYILGQEIHHRTQTFQEEFIAFLEKHNMPYDKRYVWE